MDDLPLVIKYVEVVAMEVVVLAAVVGLLIAAVRDIVDAKVQESHRRDRIGQEPVAPAVAPPEPAAPAPAAPEPAEQPR